MEWVDYIAEKDNLFDIILILTILLFFMDFFLDSDRLKYELAFLNFMSWLKVIEFLSLHKETRIFVYMFWRILIDLKSFAIIMVLFLLWFGSSFFVLRNLESDNMNMASLTHQLSL